MGARFHLRGHSRARAGRSKLLSNRVRPALLNLSGSKRNCFALVSGTGFSPVSEASSSTLLQSSGETILTTHSGCLAKFSAVFVSSSTPGTSVHPGAQNEDLGAGVIAP